MSKNIESEIREAYFTLWAAVEDGIDNDNFFQLRETFRGIRSMVEEDDKPVSELQGKHVQTVGRVTRHGEFNPIVGPALTVNDLIDAGILAVPVINLLTGAGKAIIESEIQQLMPPLPKYSPECFDGRFFKWDEYVLDTINECEDDDTMILTREGIFLYQFQFPTDGYEDDQEQYLSDILSTAKNWIDEYNSAVYPPLLQKQQA